jgi:hypothetical protein
MTGRSVQGLSKSIDLAGLSSGARRKGNHRRSGLVLAAFSMGAALLAVGFGSPEAGVAADAIINSNSPMSLIANKVQDRLSAPKGVSAATPNIVWAALDPSVRSKRNGVIVVEAGDGASSAPRHSVCVRLCDGYYFPVGPLARGADLPNHEAACSGLCPDAATQLFLEPAGSDRIEDAVTSNGARYTALPTAFRNRTVVGDTCSCHRRSGPPPLSLLNDFTLRKGDSIMTPTGIVVFRGGGQTPHTPDDFATLADASMPKDKRQVLAAIERAALSNMSQPSAAAAPPRNSQIAFAAPSPVRSGTASINKSIRFVEPMISASN